MKKCSTLLLLYAFLIFASSLYGQEIDLDFSPSFGGRQVISDVHVLNDGRLMVAGFFTGVNDRSVNNIVRLWPDGEVDTSFNMDLAGEWLLVFAVDTLTNGNYVLANTFWERTDSAQLHTLDITDKNGNIIRRMGMDYPYSEGIGIGTISFLGIDSEDHIYAGESGDFDLIVPENGRQLAKFDREGNLLKDFRADHMYRDDGSILYNDLMIQSDDRVLISGPKLAYDGTKPSAVIRLEKNGELDTSFKAAIPAGYNVLKSTLLHDGSILVSGNGPGDIFMYKLDPSGRIDYDFYFGRGVCPEDLLVTPSFLQEIAPNRILVYGTCEEHIFTRDGTPFRMLINERGQHIADFLPQLTNAHITSLTVQEDGSMYIGGAFDLEGRSVALIRTTGLPPTKITEFVPKGALIDKVYPNPLLKDELNVALLETFTGKSITYEIILPASGKTVKSGVMTVTDRLLIPTVDLPRGLYLLKVQANETKEVVRFVKH